MNEFSKNFSQVIKSILSFNIAAAPQSTEIIVSPSNSTQTVTIGTCSLLRSGIVFGSGYDANKVV
jgi:hypothetical protein